MLLKARDEGVAVAEADALGRGAPYKDDEEAMYREVALRVKRGVIQISQYPWQEGR